ncbi:MAG TPA: hypothetical protein VH333_01670 [Pseudonocardiaceae bacterium]|nr:hypothetical protein [Pseudonocardiaceae bacterium]
MTLGVAYLAHDEAAEAAAGVGLHNVDPAVTEVGDQQRAGERAETGRRHGKAPRRVQALTGGDAGHELAVHGEPVDDAQSLADRVAAGLRVDLGVGHEDVATQHLLFHLRERGAEHVGCSREQLRYLYVRCESPDCDQPADIDERSVPGHTTSWRIFPMTMPLRRPAAGRERQPMEHRHPRKA